MLQKTLASLPKTLDDTYDRILHKIDEEYAQYAFQILQWLAYSSRPLRIEEIVEVTAVDTKNGPRYSEERRLSDPSDIDIGNML